MLWKKKDTLQFLFFIGEAKLQFQRLTEKQGDLNAVQLVIQDVNLPDGEGFELCRWIKEQVEMPVLFLTARDLEEDVLKGYDLGAGKSDCGSKGMYINASGVSVIEFVDKHTLAVNINQLRRKLENAEHKYISNVYGMGYQWIG